VDHSLLGGSSALSDYEVNTRSDANVLRWMEYLPQDCIETMIRMGWDLTT